MVLYRPRAKDYTMAMQNLKIKEKYKEKKRA